MTCRYDQAAEDYLTEDGDLCRVDDDGWPTKHCSARKTCALHVGIGELTCARCLGRCRTDINTIEVLAALMLGEALVAGVDSEAANLAGPAADVEAWSWRKVAAMQGRSWHLSMVEDDDDWHPYTVLTRWAHMISEDYDTQRPEQWGISNAADFLARILHRVAQDGEQDFPLLAREMRKCRTHLENVRRDSQAPERGVPCPTCKASDEAKLARNPNHKGRLVPLEREYPHWCDDLGCERMHYADDSEDRWVCPRDSSHWWSHRDYTNRLEERKSA